MDRNLNKTSRRAGRRWPFLALGLAATALVAAWWFVPRAAEDLVTPEARPATSDVEREQPVAQPPQVVDAAPEPVVPGGPDIPGLESIVPKLDPGAISEAEMLGEGTWEVVDLEEVRRALPENLYWELSVPTEDPEIVEKRAAERRRWNDEWGKILSGNATEDEIQGYYDHRARLSGDYIEFVTYLLDHYGEDLPERDVGFLELARKLHAARLEEIPRKVEEAMERKRQQDEARARWLADQAAFEGTVPNEAADPPGE